MIWNLPLPNNYFTGRESYIVDIDKEFSLNKSQIAITGMGGMGKTQLAKQYANLNKHKYDLIWWFDSENDLSEQYKNLAIELNENPKLLDSEKINLNSSTDFLVKAVRNILRTKNINWLLIFDNAKDEHSIINYLPEKHNQNLGHILITSRNSLSWNKSLGLKEFSSEESIKLLAKLTNSSSNNLISIVKKLDNYPLALPLIASFIKLTSNIEEQDFKKLFKSTAYNNPNLDNYKYGIKDSLNLSIQALKSESEQAYELLVFCAFINNKNISFELLQSFLGKNQQDKLDDIIKLLIKYSLISKVNLSTSDLRVKFNIHEVLQQTIIDGLNNQERRNYLTKLLKLMVEIIPLYISEIYYTQPETLNHIKSLAENSLKFKVINNELLEIYIELFVFEFEERVNYKECKKLLGIIELAILPNIKNIRDHLKVEYLFNKSKFLISRFIDYSGAIKEILLAKEIVNKNSNLQAKYNFYLNLKLAQANLWLGNLNLAMQNVLKAEKTFNSEIHPAIKKVGLQDTFSVIYFLKGDYNQAYEYRISALKGFKAIRRQDENCLSDIFYELSNSEILLAMGKKKEAFIEANKLYLKAKNFYGEEPHDTTAKSLLIIADSAHQLGDFDLAQNKIKECLAIYKALYGSDKQDFDIANAHIIQGNIYYSKNKFTEALQQYEIALKTFNYIYKTKETYNYSLLYKKLALVNFKLNNKLEVEKYLNLHNHYFPMDRIIIKSLLNT